MPMNVAPENHFQYETGDKAGMMAEVYLATSGSTPKPRLTPAYATPSGTLPLRSNALPITRISDASGRVYANGGNGNAKPLVDQANDLVKLNKGKNSVTLRTSTQQIRYDLAGRSHGGVPTPHKQIYNREFCKWDTKKYNTNI